MDIQEGISMCLFEVNECLKIRALPMYWPPVLANAPHDGHLPSYGVSGGPSIR